MGNKKIEKTYKIELTKTERKILHNNMGSVEDWLQNLVDAKLKEIGYKLIQDNTDRQAHKLSKQQRNQILDEMSIPAGLTMDDIVAKNIQPSDLGR